MKVLVPFLLAALALQLHAAPTLGAVKVTPMTAVIGTVTQVTIAASITDRSLIPGSVNLVQVNSNGTTTILGALHDDGLNGDTYSGDLVFTFVAALSSPSANQVQLQVSAAFRGVLQRVKSPIMSVFFQAADAPQQAIVALAQSLASGNTALALNYVVPSEYSTVNTLTPQAATVLASMLKSAVLASSQNDLRVFRSPFVTPYGRTTTVELTMVPGPTGQWLINSW